MDTVIHAPEPYPAPVYSPPTVRPSMRMVGAATEPRNSRSLPISEMLKNISFRLPATVISSTGIGELAAGDPQAGGAARVVAGHQIHAVAEKLGDVQAFFDFADDFFRSLRSRLQKVISRTDAGSARQSARGIAGRLQA